MYDSIPRAAPEAVEPIIHEKKYLSIYNIHVHHTTRCTVSITHVNKLRREYDRTVVVGKKYDTTTRGAALETL